MKLKFCGAAKVVTGSCYLLEVGATKMLVDCGMYQGPKEIAKLNYRPFMFDPSEIDFMLLTHAHIDHCGLIPKLHKEGFTGNIYATTATRDLVEILLEDSANIQEQNVEEQNKIRIKQHLPLRQPLFTQMDAQKCMPLFKPIEYTKLTKINDQISVRYWDAGHILGSASIEVFVTEGDKQTKIVFSGDIGQRDVPIIQDPTLIGEADYVLMESTYGDKLHEDTGGKEELLMKYIMETFNKGGKLMIPTFAVERTQELLYFIEKFINRGVFPKQKIFLDSPLAKKATDVFSRHKECYDTEALKEFSHPLDTEYLDYALSAEDSMKLNKYPDPCIIMAGNGMCTAGRIRHHLKHSLGNPRNTLLFVGYQAEGTLGREILEGAKEVFIIDRDVEVNVDVHKIDSFSGHADANQLLRRAKGFTSKPKKLFIVHGEGNAQLSLQKSLNDIGFTTYIPSLGEEIEL